MSIFQTPQFCWGEIAYLTRIRIRPDDIREVWARCSGLNNVYRSEVVEQKIIQVIRDFRTYTPEKIIEKTGLSRSAIESILFSLESRGFIKILSGGSFSIIEFEVIRALPA